MIPTTATGIERRRWPTASGAAVATTAADHVTLVEETTFCLSSRTGDIVPGGAHGLFFLDTRFLSQLQLAIDGAPVRSLGLSIERPFAATYFGQTVPANPLENGPLVVFRRRFIGRGLVEKVRVQNYSAAPVATTIELAMDGDFADLFEVKERRQTDGRARHVHASANGWRIESDAGRPHIRVSATFSSSPEADAPVPTWRVTLAPQSSWEVCVEVAVEVDDVAIDPSHHCDVDVELGAPERRRSAWLADMPTVATDHHALGTALHQTTEDLGALRIVDPDHAEDVIIAAGAPWYMTVFGRDSLLTAHMALLADPAIALGVLRTLGRLQGVEADELSDEAPGKILHEIRFRPQDPPSWAFADSDLYYGTVDATPLYLMLLGEARRWGLSLADLRSLLPAADRALAWIDANVDERGYLRYRGTATPGQRLANQGWKDSWDGVRFADGRFPRGPIALCEVQGYVYAAYLARADVADSVGDAVAADGLRRRAARLRRHFREDFWLDGPQHLALGLDGDGEPIDALASNMGHCLWTGIVDADLAPAVAEHLLAPELFSGWGVRTLATSMAAYNPLSYHNGSVWPHDNALIAAGLRRYGFDSHAHRIIDAMCDVSRFHGGRLPELFSGIDRRDLAVPAVYAESCIPQAWSAAAPLLFLRTILGLEPDVPRSVLRLAPSLPPTMTRLELHRVPLAGCRLDLAVTDPPAVEVHGLPAELELVRRPAPVA